MAKKSTRTKAPLNSAPKPRSRRLGGHMMQISSAHPAQTTAAGVSIAIERCATVMVRLGESMSYHGIDDANKLSNLAVELGHVFKLDISDAKLAKLLIGAGDPTGDDIVDIINQHLA